INSASAPTGCRGRLRREVSSRWIGRGGWIVVLGWIVLRPRLFRHGPTFHIPDVWSAYDGRQYSVQWRTVRARIYPVIDWRPPSYSARSASALARAAREPRTQV